MACGVVEGMGLQGRPLQQGDILSRSRNQGESDPTKSKGPEPGRCSAYSVRQEEMPADGAQQVSGRLLAESLER